MLPCSGVPFVLGLHGVTAGNGSLFKDYAWYVLVCSGGQEQHSLAGLQVIWLSDTMCSVEGLPL